MAMVENKSTAAKVSNAVIVVILAIIALSCLYPLWYTLCLSISEKAAVDAGWVTLYPVGFSIANYEKIIGDSIFLNSVWISVGRVLVGTPLTLVVIVLVAYPISKSSKDFKGRNVVIWSLLFCMLFGAGLVPWYISMVKLKMVNSFWGLILSTGLPIYYVILVMNFFRNIPKELEEAAIMDGAGQWRLLLSIVLPCSLPVLATITLFVGVNYWNEYYNGLLLSTTDKHYPLMTYIKSLVVPINNATSMTPEQLKKAAKLSNDGLNSAKVFVALIPMLVVYPWLQKYFVSGIMIGSVKE